MTQPSPTYPDPEGRGDELLEAIRDLTAVVDKLNRLAEPLVRRFGFAAFRRTV